MKPTFFGIILILLVWFAPFTSVTASAECEQGFTDIRIIPTDTGFQVEYICRDGDVIPDPNLPGDYDLVVNECKKSNDAWIFCDDFEDSSTLTPAGDNPRWGVHNKGVNKDSIRNPSCGIDNSACFEISWSSGEISGGGLFAYFGDVPEGIMYNGFTAHRSDDTFRDVFVRFYLRHDNDFVGYPAKLSRVRVETQAGSSFHMGYPAMINHLLGHSFGTSSKLWVTSYTNVTLGGDSLLQLAYNPHQAMDKAYRSRPNSNLGHFEGKQPVMEMVKDKWVCIEYQTKLNTPGNNDGLTKVWVNGILDTVIEEQNFVEDYTDRGINSVYLEGYWNSSSPKKQSRYFDNFIISEKRIGCGK